jgi:arylsulfatase A-like enzyme
MEGKHSSDAITDLSLEWLSSKRDRNKPFFLMHHFKAPHDMFENAKRYDEYLEDVEIPEPDNLFTPPAGSEGSKGMGSGVGRTHAPWNLARKLGVPDLPNDRDYAKAGYQKYLKRYLRCVKGVDDNIQRLIDYLKATGELDNTIIIYTSDQGVFLGEHDLMDKRWMYEESSRMPFIVCAPKRLQSGSTNDWLINNADFAPTILELAGIQKTPDYMQGRSFADALVGGAKPADWRTSLYYRYWMHLAHSLAVPAHFGLRDERYKLIFFYGCDLEGKNRTPAAWEFYDLEKDPHEMQNEYSNPEYAEIIAGMKQDLKRTRDELQETDKKYPAIQAIIDAHWHK